MTGRNRPETALEAFEEAAQRSPGPEDWGHFFRCDQTSSADPRSGSFCWFEDRSQLLQFIRDSQAYVCPGPEGADVGGLLDVLGFVVHMTARGKFKGEKALTEINRTLRRFSQVEWMGSFEDLCGDDGDFQRRVRAWFRADGNDSPIHADQRQAFGERLREFPA